MTLLYNTRDGNGKDIVKNVEIKEFPTVEIDGECPVCKNKISYGVSIKKAVSSKFTDWTYVDDYICPECSRFFSLYFYNYIADRDGIRLLNVRQLRDELCRPQKTPFRFIISTTQKKHLFYRSILNYDNKRFAVNLETEIIYTTCERMKMLFDFVENLQTLGASKLQMQNGELPIKIVQLVGFDCLTTLQSELQNSREIQIPLYCGQKREIEEDVAKCNIIFALTTLNAAKQR